VKDLVEHGEKVNIKDDNGNAPIYLAPLYDYKNIVDFLMIYR